MNKKTSLGDSFRQRNTPQNLVNSLHSDLCSNNELTITESVNTEEWTADNNNLSIHTDSQTPPTTKDSDTTNHSDQAFMKMEGKFSASEGYKDCEMSILSSKVDLFNE